MPSELGHDHLSRLTPGMRPLPPHTPGASNGSAEIACIRHGAESGDEPAFLAKGAIPRLLTVR